MLAEILAFAITILLGPVAYVIIGARMPKHLKRFPISVADGIGDTLLWPLFNALAVSYGLLELPLDWSFIVAILVSGLVTVWFTYWRKDVATHDDWSRPSVGRYSVGGWYHTGFFFCQGIIFLWVMINLYAVPLLWAPPAAFALLAAYRVFFHLPRQLAGR